MWPWLNRTGPSCVPNLSLKIPSLTALSRFPLDKMMNGRKTETSGRPQRSGGSKKEAWQGADDSDRKHLTGLGIGTSIAGAKT
jgi:hypothetical protein